MAAQSVRSSRHFLFLAKATRYRGKETHGKSQEEARLADTGIADENKLEKVIIVPLPAGGLGTGGWGHRCALVGRLWLKNGRKAAGWGQEIRTRSIDVIITQARPFCVDLAHRTSQSWSIIAASRSRQNGGNKRSAMPMPIFGKAHLIHIHSQAK